MSGLLYLVDTFSLVFQVFHALPPMTGPKGQPTNAIFGFTRDVETIRNNRQPTHLVCGLESPGPGVRHELYPDYKANRGKMPDDLRAQIPLVLEVIEGFGIPAISCNGWEADDVLATLARHAVEQGFEVCIVTADKDARQLLSPRVRLYNIRKDVFYDEQSLKNDWGIRSDQVVDFQALVGDAVDNVPGIPLVGPKKARTLLEQFGTLEEVLAHADEIRGPKLRENLKRFADQALLSRKLVTLNTDLPISIDWDAARVREPDRKRLYGLFTDCGFRRFAADMREVNSGKLSNAAEPSTRTWTLVDTPKRFDDFLAELRQQRRFCVDLETTSLNAVQAEIVGWAFSWQANAGWYLPVDGPSGQPKLDAEAVLSAVRPLLEDPDIEIVNQNIKYDMLVLRRAGIHLHGVGTDPMVGDYLLDAGARSHGLDALAERYLNHRTIPISDLIGSGKQQKKMFEVDTVRAAEYAAEDADIAWQLAEIITTRLREEGLWELYRDLERPLISVLVEMEFAGIRVDVDELRRQSTELGQRLEQLIAEIHELAGHDFNIDSPKQLAVVLYEELALPIFRRTKTGASTAQDVLEKLAPLHPLPAKITEHRHLKKLKGTYLDALPNMVNPETDRIHASFNQVVAATGRLSSSDPNLQNIPIRTAEGRKVRRAFVPAAPDWKLISADYSQVELRILAHFSGDLVMQAAFRDGADIHTAVAAEIFDIPVDQVDRDQRRVAKAVNFGVIYGQSPFGLATALGISQEHAAEFIDNYFEKYAGVDRYLTELLEECSRTGYARTILGRRRAISGIQSTTGRQRNLPERTAINTVIQGSAADLIKRAMIDIQTRLTADRHTGRMLLQIHDELVFESPTDDVPSLIEMVRSGMETAMELSVPLVVDVKVGENWLDMEPC